MRSSIRLVLVGLAVAFIASTLARMLQPESATRPRAAALDVVVAARDIDVGQVLVAEDLAAERVADSPKARTGIALAAAAVGRTASTAIRKGQLVREDDLAAPGAGASLASLVPPGQRAVTVALRDSGPGPALYPGAFVDVLVTADIPSKASGFREAMTRTVIERSRVLAVNDLGIGGKAPATSDSRDRRTAPRNPTITLLVTPDQAAQLELASVRGTVGIALCAGADAASGPVAAPGITTSGMLGITIEPDPAPSVTPPPAPPQVAPEPDEPEEPEPQAPAEPPKPQVWEVVVVRGENTVKHGFPIKTPPSPESPAPAPAAPAEPKR
jgi:pilus assembly protein CpaB